MEPVYLFNLAHRHSDWLAVRQSVVAQNVANANTPGFKALDVEAFSSVLDTTRLEMAATNSSHMNFSGAQKGAEVTERGSAWEVLHSGNDISLDEELLKAGEVNGAFSLNTSVTKAFHRMLLASSKG